MVYRCFHFGINTMQANIDTMAIKHTEIGRKIITMETKHLRMNNKRGTAIKLNGEAVDDVVEFMYLGSKMRISRKY